MDRRSFLLTTTALIVARGAAAKAKGPNLGDARLIANIPALPGFPENVAIRGRIAYVTGAAQFGYFEQPKLLAYHLDTGALLKEYPIAGQNPALPQALSGIALDKLGYVYVLDFQQGIIRINPVTGVQTPYSDPIPAITPQGPLPNELIFDKQGNAYVSDSLQGTIWKIPAGGGAPQVWLQSPTLAPPAVSFGPNGMRLDHNGKYLYFAVTFTATNEGVIYRIPFKGQPDLAELEVFHTYAVGEGPDGIAFGKSKNLYVALAGSNQISVLNKNGIETARYGGLIENPSDPNSPLPYANPAAFALDDETRSLVTVNHAIFFPAPQPFALFSVFVDDKAQPLEEPKL